MMKLMTIILVTMLLHVSFSGAGFVADVDPEIAKDIVSVYGAGVTVSFDGSDRSWMVVRDANGEIRGYATSTSPQFDMITGYGGPTPLLICVDTVGTVVATLLLSNLETPFYIDKVYNQGLLATWNGLSWKQASQHSVDAVTGATQSSRAIIESFRQRLTMMQDPGATQ